MKKFAIASLVATVVLAGSLFITGDALARGRSTSVTGPGQNTATRDVNAGMTSEGYQRSVTTTGPGGKSATRGSTTTATRSGNTVSTTSNVTGPGGNTGTVSTSTTVNR